MAHQPTDSPYNKKPSSLSLFASTTFSSSSCSSPSSPSSTGNQVTNTGPSSNFSSVANRHTADPGFTSNDRGVNKIDVFAPLPKIGGQRGAGRSSGSTPRQVPRSRAGNRGDMDGAALQSLAGQIIRRASQLKQQLEPFTTGAAKARTRGGELISGVMLNLVEAARAQQKKIQPIAALTRAQAQLKFPKIRNVGRFSRLVRRGGKLEGVAAATVADAVTTDYPLFEDTLDQDLQSLNFSVETEAAEHRSSSANTTVAEKLREGTELEGKQHERPRTSFPPDMFTISSRHATDLLSGDSSSCYFSSVDDSLGESLAEIRAETTTEKRCSEEFVASGIEVIEKRCPEEFELEAGIDGLSVVQSLAITKTPPPPSADWERPRAQPGGPVDPGSILQGGSFTRRQTAWYYRLKRRITLPRLISARLERRLLERLSGFRPLQLLRAARPLLASSAIVASFIFVAGNPSAKRFELPTIDGEVLGDFVQHTVLGNLRGGNLRGIVGAGESGEDAQKPAADAAERGRLQQVAGSLGAFDASDLYDAVFPSTAKGKASKGRVNQANVASGQRSNSKGGATPFLEPYSNDEIGHQMRKVNFIAGMIASALPADGHLTDSGALARHIVEVSDKLGSDPFYVAAIISVESRFGTHARSHVGATGLMQLLPDTAQEVAEDITGVRGDPVLTDPRTNIRLGVEYISDLETKYSGNRNWALAAYNWGPANVDKALKDKRNFPGSVSRYAQTVLRRSTNWRSQFEKAERGAKALARAKMKVDSPSASVAASGISQIAVSK